MKKLINILLASMFLFTTTGCEDDVTVKTPGEIAAEKINSLLSNNTFTNLGRVDKDSPWGYYRFRVEDTYLIIMYDDQPHYYDLNHMISFKVNSNQTVIFYFENYDWPTLK